MFLHDKLYTWVRSFWNLMIPSDLSLRWCVLSIFCWKFSREFWRYCNQLLNKNKLLKFLNQEKRLPCLFDTICVNFESFCCFHLISFESNSNCCLKKLNLLNCLNPLLIKFGMIFSFYMYLEILNPIPVLKFDAKFYQNPFNLYKFQLELSVWELYSLWHLRCSYVLWL